MLFTSNHTPFHTRTTTDFTCTSSIGPMRRRRLAFISLGLVLLASAGYVGAANVGPPGSTPRSTAPVAPTAARFVTYNVVRGTRMPVPRLLVQDSIVETNLTQIGKHLAAQQPTIVALQETEWGEVPNAQHIARAGAFQSWVDDRSVHGEDARHGSALIGTVPLEAPASDVLARGTTFRKGWVAATVSIPAFDGQDVRVVAVHLDPLSPAARARQVDQLVAAFRDEPAPTVIMGDFNCDWDERGCVRRAAEALEMTEAPTHGQATYRFAGLRRSLDWILVSRQLRVVSTGIVDDPYSDHCAVVADVVTRVNEE